MLSVSSLSMDSNLVLKPGWESLLEISPVSATWDGALTTQPAPPSTATLSVEEMTKDTSGSHEHY